VRRVAQDLQTEWARWRAARAKHELLSAGARADWGGGDLAAVEQEVARAAAAVEGYLRELRAIGCELRVNEVSHVDFRTLRDDRAVHLCWRLGEARITHWHAIGAGFDARQPIDGAILTEITT
jgi:hypothetical protein